MAPLVAAAYVLGTFPTAVLVGRAYGRDVTQEGSGNPGATNVYRVAGTKAGIVVFFVDMLKGALAAGLGLAVDGEVLAYVAGIAAVLGHCFPVQRRFRGGRGVATAAGVVAVIEPVVIGVAALVWLVIARVAKKASLASLVAAIGVPVALVALARPPEELVGVFALAVLIVLRHADNIVRLVRGQERSLRETT